MTWPCNMIGALLRTRSCSAIIEEECSNSSWIRLSMTRLKLPMPLIKANPSVRKREAGLECALRPLPAVRGQPSDVAAFDFPTSTSTASIYRSDKVIGGRLRIAVPLTRNTLLPKMDVCFGSRANSQRNLPRAQCNATCTEAGSCLALPTAVQQWEPKMATIIDTTTWRRSTSEAGMIFDFERKGYRHRFQ